MSHLFHPLLALIASAGDNMLFAVGDGTDSAVYFWDDTSSDVTVDTAELTQVALLNIVDNDTMTAADFAVTV